MTKRCEKSDGREIIDPDRSGCVILHSVSVMSTQARDEWKERVGGEMRKWEMPITATVPDEVNS